MVAIYGFVLICLVAVVSGYSNTTHICCGSTVELKTNNSSYCCGDRPYDFKKEVCCGQGVVLPTEKGMDSCCLDKKTKTATLYDFSNSTCCDGVVVENPVQPEFGDRVYYSCCGTELYDTDAAICCNGVEYPKEDDQRCCGEKIISTQSQICNFAFDEKEEKWNEKPVDVPNNHTQLCKGEQYNTEDTMCCWSAVAKQEVLVKKDESLKDMMYPSTCEDPDGNILIFNYSSKACDQDTGKLVDVPEDQQKKDTWHSVCNGELYNSTTHGCCNKVLKEREEDYYGFCCGDDLLTNYTTQVCCGNEILPQNENGTLMCCDGKLIDSTTHMCCDGEQEIVKDQLCCFLVKDEESLYDSKTERCTRNGVQMLDPEETQKMLNLDPLCLSQHDIYF